jgi:hypothetical protein
MCKASSLKKSQYLILVLINLLIAASVSADPQKIFICADGTFGAQIPDFAKIKRADFNGSNLVTIRTGTDSFIRGCQVDSTLDKMFVLELDTVDHYYKIYRVNPDNSSQTTLQFPVPGENFYNIFGSFAVDALASNLFWPDSTNFQIKYASSVNPRVVGPPAQNDPQILFTSDTAGVSAPNDLEIDPINRMLYVGNGNGGITRIDLDGSGSEAVISGGPGVFGVAVDPFHNRIFYTLDNNSVFTAGLNGANPIELTNNIGAISDSAHRRMDIDYDVDTDKIYWVEWADPIPPFGGQATPGKLRRANPDGTGAEDVIADLGYRALYLSFQYGTLKPKLNSPRSGQTYVSEFPFYYQLGEPAAAGTVKMNLKQGANIVASMTMINEQNVTGSIMPFSANANSLGFVTASSGFPVAEGSYTIELTYQDAAGNPASSTSATNVNLALPTATATNTPTKTNTSTPTSTATITNTPTTTATATGTNTPSATTVGGDDTPVITPTAFTPTVGPDSQCISTTALPLVKIKGRKASLTIIAIKGTKYKFSAKPIGSPARKAINKPVTSLKNGKLNFAFGLLKGGLWEFSYSVKEKKISTQSCPVQKSI